MKKRTLIILLGLWVALIPSLGLPGQWKNWITLATGVIIALVAFKRKKIYIEVHEEEKP